MTKFQMPKLLTVSLALVWAIRFIPVVGPLQKVLLTFDTAIHELCHCLAGLISGGSQILLVISADKWGSYSSMNGGSEMIFRPAGHIGAALLFCLCILIANKYNKVRMLNTVVGIMLVVLLTSWQRPDSEQDMTSQYVVFSISAWLIGFAIVAPRWANKILINTLGVMVIWQELFLILQTAAFSKPQDYNDANWTAKAWGAVLSGNQIAELWALIIGIAVIAVIYQVSRKHSQAAQ